jgi:hypothetical protein
VVREDINQMKGVAFLGMLAAVRRDLGEPVAARVVSSLNEEMRRLLENQLFTKSGWFPVSWYRELLGSLQDVAGADAVRECSRAAVVHDLQSGIYKLVTKVLSPRWLIQSTPKVFNSYYRKGKCVVELSKTEQNVGTVSFHGCPGFDGPMWEDLAGGCLGMLEAAGAKNAHETRRDGGRDGDEFMVLELRWEG